MIETPVLFLVKSVSNATQTVFDSILFAKPKKIYIASIILNNDKNNEIISNYIESLVNQIVWKCDVKTKINYSEKNIHKLQCESVDWLFKKEEKGIIINSDCLPNKCFYSFCDDLLNHYKNDNRIMYINSINIKDSIKVGDGSYFFSKYNQTGAWATWKRTWLTIQPNLNNLNRALGLKTLDNVLSNSEFDYWLKQFQIDDPDVTEFYNYKTLLSQWFNNGLAITPNSNLSCKIQENSTLNSKDFKKFHQNAILEIVDLRHPTFITNNKFSDEKLFENYYKKSSFLFIIKTMKTKMNSIVKNNIDIADKYNNKINNEKHVLLNK
ncbi:MAG: hypothetical protein ACOYMA_03135 [Bacteroidia bacterium]